MPTAGSITRSRQWCKTRAASACRIGALNFLGAARAVAALVAVAALGACHRGGAGDSPFPLAAGHRWTYDVTTRSDDGSIERESLTLRTLGAESLAALGDQTAWHRRSDSGIDYWLRADATGIYRVASKSDLDPEPQLDRPARFVLKAPYVVGTQWQTSTTAYLLMRRNEFPREIRHTHPSVPMAYAIEAVNESVQVKAGVFDRCLRVKGTASVHIYADPASGWRDMPLTTVEWYCAGVGLVKMERSEPAQSAFLSGGARTLELDSWE
ncbi:hypothetical protein BH11PSE8_BH11PSE8_21760 [soil metagenome]